MEARIVSGYGLKFAAIKAGKFRRNHFDAKVMQILNPATFLLNARDAFKVVQGLGQSMALLRREKPDVVFCKGGFVALPVGLAAALLRRPLVIHESDVTPGLGTKILARYANKIAVGFPVKHYKEFEAGKLVYTGNPVRQEIVTAQRREGLERFELSDDLPVVLVTGGSQGAAEVNDAVTAALAQLVEFCQVIHVTGEAEYERVKFAVSRLGKLPHSERYQVFGYLAGDMALALAAADIVLSRAGATTISELAALKKPTILIPNMAMAGHQVENARMLARAGAARVLEGAKATSGRLVGEIKRLAGDREERESLGRGIAAFGRDDAAKELAQLILATGRVGEGSK
jgi:UDP-N-acetylglucosamine--N-acetylmuramyl-(pentapeptide) pyrophosphoryl-undecaprenol N-acetylglucosamine transferase